jgi:hypothetical protein
VVVYYITASGSKRLTMMENSATANISTTGAWQKLLRRNGSWQVLSTNYAYALTVVWSLFVAGVANIVVFDKVLCRRLMLLDEPCTFKNWLVARGILMI